MKTRWILALTLAPIVGCGDDTAGSGGTGPTTGASGGSDPGSGGSSTSSATTSAASTTSAGPGGAGGGGGAAACDSGLTQASEACTTCQDASCCLTATAAAEAPGTWTTSGAKICREANCATECGVPEPECGGIQPSPASCTDELYASCCAEVTACAQSDACVAIIYLCIDDQGCFPGQEPCWSECLALYADGADLFDSLDACFATVTCG